MVITKRVVIQMLIFRNIDKVELHLPVDPQWFKTLLGQLADAGEMVGFPTHKVSDGSLYGRSGTIEFKGHTLKVGVYAQYKSRWVSYNFKGSLLDAAEFGCRTALMGEYSFVDAMNYGRVKCLELAIDYHSLRANEVLVHRRGARKGMVVTNKSATGSTYYVGKPKSAIQFVAYDKARELEDKGESCFADNLLRLEFRYRNSKLPLAGVVPLLMKDDPFRDLMVVPRAKALAHWVTDKYWQSFVNSSAAVGVPTALSYVESKKNRRLFVARLAELSDLRLAPSASKFEAALKNLCPKDSLWAFVSTPFIGDKEGIEKLQSIAFGGCLK